MKKFLTTLLVLVLLASPAWGAWNYPLDATTSNSGEVELATSAETIAGTDTAKVVTPDGLAYTVQRGTMTYAADNEASDTYVITLVPAIDAYVTGMKVTFYAKTANTGAASININGKGAKTIKKAHDQDLVTGDVEAGQHVLIEYDGTHFQMLSATALSATYDPGNVAITGGTITGITDLAIADGGTGASTAANAFTALKQNATDAATGVVELATNEETVTGTATDRVTTPANITAKMSAPGAIGDDTPAAGTFTDVSATGTVESDATPTPSVEFKDSDCTDSDVNAKIYVDATATGTGAEVVDMYFQAQGAQGTAGTLEDLMHYDASEGQATFYSNLGIQDTTGGLHLKKVNAVGTATAAKTFAIQVNIPTGAKIFGCQLRNDVVLTSSDGGTTYSAAYSGGGSGVISSGTAFAKNTKENSFTSEVASGEADITITCDGGKTFAADGQIRAIVYYYEFTAMGDAS